MSAAPAAEVVYSDAPPHASVRVEESASPTALLIRCEQLHAADKTAEGRKRLFLTLAIVCGGLAFASVFIAGPGEMPRLFIATGVFAALTLLFVALRAAFGRADIDDRKLVVVQRLFESLRGEMHKKRPAKLWMDFGGYDKSKAREDTTSMFNSTGTKLFVKPWLRLTFTLLDGTEVALHAKSTCKRKQRAKRKYTKIKDVITDELTVYVKPPSSRPLDPAALPKVQAVLQGGGGLAGRGVKVKPRLLSVSFRFGPGRRLRGRGGWSGTSLEQLLDGDRALHAVIFSYRAMRAAQAAQAG